MDPEREPARETIPCPLCGSRAFEPWARENGFDCVRCSDCGLLYVNPRPTAASIDRAVQLGCHGKEANELNVVGARIGGKVREYRHVIARMFDDVLGAGAPFSWLDVGAGFGELVEAATSLAPAGSTCEGVEPMLPKAREAQSRGIPIRSGYLADIDRRYDFISLIDVFSHIPDFRSFLEEVKGVLSERGELLVKTGNNADLGARRNVPEPLTLPDHLVFAGERHVTRFLEEAGFAIVRVERRRYDGFGHSARNVVKWLLRRPVVPMVPYTSGARALYLRARRV